MTRYTQVHQVDVQFQTSSMGEQIHWVPLFQLTTLCSSLYSEFEGKYAMKSYSFEKGWEYTMLLHNTAMTKVILGDTGSIRCILVKIWKPWTLLSAECSYDFFGNLFNLRLGDSPVFFTRLSWSTRAGSWLQVFVSIPALELASLSTSSVSKSVEEGRLGLLDIRLAGKFFQLAVNRFSFRNREAGRLKGRRAKITRSSGKEVGKMVVRLIAEKSGMRAASHNIYNIQGTNRAEKTHNLDPDPFHCIDPTTPTI